jgi:phospholipid/cholesterol/gamma-HCH transport system substrate-binding protein
VRVGRWLAALALLAAIAVVVVLVAHRSTAGPRGYMVRAVFDSSSFVIPGEDVKVAGVKVGSISSVALTPQNKAAIVLEIDNRRYQPFRADAHCEIGLESLLGEQFVQCTSTQPRPPGSAPPPPLALIASGADRGQHLLPVQNTTAPVGIDLLADITRLPQQQRLQLVISGLGAGLAGNGQELNAALLRADPALQQTDRVIHVLASENRVLARLTDQSDRILGPLAAQRAHVGGFIEHVGEVAQAAAAQGHAIEQNLVDFPPFLRQLTPAAQRLTALADQMTPALQVLQAQAPAINRSIAGLGPLAKSSIPTLKTLGNVAQRGETVFPKIHDVVLELSKLGKPLLPLASDLAALSSSFDAAGGIEDVMRFIYYYTGTVNGEDAVSHYIRSSFEVGGCSARSSIKGAGCGSTFATTTVGAAARAAARRASAARASGARTSAASAGARATAAPKPALSGQPADATMNTLIDYLLKP